MATPSRAGYLLIVFPVGISRISMEEARPMENKTLPIPGDDRWIYCPAGCFPPTSLPGMISDSLILSLES